MKEAEAKLHLGGAARSESWRAEKASLINGILSNLGRLGAGRGDSSCAGQMDAHVSKVKPTLIFNFTPAFRQVAFSDGEVCVALGDVDRFWPRTGPSRSLSRLLEHP